MALAKEPSQLRCYTLNYIFLVIGEISVQSMVVLYGEVGNGFFLKLAQPFLENINRRSRSDRSQGLITVFQIYSLLILIA